MTKLRTVNLILKMGLWDYKFGFLNPGNWEIKWLQSLAIHASKGHWHRDKKIKQKKPVFCHIQYIHLYLQTSLSQLFQVEQMQLLPVNVSVMITMFTVKTCTAGHKNVAPYFCSYLRQLLTDFQNFFTGTLCRQFATTWLIYRVGHKKTTPLHVS